LVQITCHLGKVIFGTDDKFHDFFHLSLFVLKAQKHNMAIAYSGQDSETTMVPNTAINDVFRSSVFSNDFYVVNSFQNSSRCLL